MIAKEILEDYCRALYDAWNAGDMETFYAGIDDHVTDHNAGEGETGIEGVRDALDTVRSAFPDHRYEVLDVVADPDQMLLSVRLRCTGTHEGDLFGIPPSGRTATWMESRYVKLVPAEEENPVFPVKTKEHWAIIDGLAMMTQLGHVPAPGTRDTW